MDLELAFAIKTAWATFLYQVGRLLSGLGHRLSGKKAVPEPDPKSPEGVVFGANRVLGLFEAKLCIEYQIYCRAEKRGKRAPMEYDQWFLAKHIPIPFRQDEQVKWGDILALTAGGHYNRSLLVEASKLNAHTVANYLLLDRAGLVGKGH